MERLVSFDIIADFGFLKKPDTNEPMYLTFNMIHKPFVLGLLGAILGERGFQENEMMPDYYLELINTTIGIKPLNDEKGNCQKTVIRYNNGVGFASNEAGGNLIVTEQTLVNPSFRIYLLTDNQELIQRIQYHEAEFLPYFGKNDFALWWENVQVYDYKKFEPQDNYKVSSIFIKKAIVKDGVERDDDMDFLEMNFIGDEFMYFERLPIGYDDELYQYKYQPFVYTTFKLLKNYQIDNLYQLNSDEVIQIF